MAGGPAADEGQSRQVTFTDECQFNMVVPSSKSIRKYMSDYKLDTSTPGILKSSINTFVKFHGVREYVKLSIDGKKLSYRIGKLGEEDLGGRTVRHQKSSAGLAELTKRFCLFTCIRTCIVYVVQIRLI